MCTLQEIIKELLSNGIEITMSWKNEQVTYDVGTYAKSHLHFTHDESKNILNVSMRYDETDVINLNRPLDDVLSNFCECVRGCMCGREYVSEDWLKLLVKRNVISVIKEEKTRIIF